MEKFKEVVIFTAENSALAAMLVGKLKEFDIPARLGAESATAGVFGVPEGSRTILVPEKYAPRAEEILYER
ncbi:MAG: hypothetical protein A2Z11_04830 [Candidatus Woykebacteria bacterium RBG_16_43_9]|uniref:DUF2007 domain-containing protein n=1 Tax=Candidatus Woykebacteria bacterium RBG_16_43_9 TaxID=1802596 RepID=A0A1G1WB95_9BACT|nr:MAG: hypothetical protein A2Z11_04830 [Candidatus Woykebacteria bacterium RBG_16_43_9]